VTYKQSIFSVYINTMVMVHLKMENL